MKTEDECKINGLQLTELTYDMLTGKPAVKLTYALIQADQNGRVLDTHGKVTAPGGSMSAASRELLRQLLTSIETDLLPRHFKQDTKEATHEARATATGSEEVDQI